MTQKSKRTRTVERARTRKLSRRKRRTKIESSQWDLPASFTADGKRMASLREVLDPEVPTMSFSQLSDKQRADLVANRIASQPYFQIAMLGAGLIDRKRALQEVKARSKIGRNLIEIEQRLIHHLAASTRRRPQ